MDFPHGAPAVTRRKIHFANPQGVASRHFNQSILHFCIVNLTYVKESLY